MNKILNKTKFKTEIIASAIVFTMMLLFYITNGISPCGSQTILTSDLFHQYAPFLIEMCDKFSNRESLIYSLQNGLGMSFLGNIITYMLSPFNLIILLLGKHNIQESIAIIILLKTVLSAFTFSFATKRILKNDENLNIPFAILYALSSFFLAYYWNIMWMDALYMLPLIVFGLHQMVNDKKYLLYTISLFYSIMVNYYMGFMLCIASCIFYLFFYITKEEKFEIKHFMKTSLEFAKWSICAGIIAIVIIMPGLTMLSNSSATNDALSTIGISFSPITLLSNHLPFTTVSFRTTTSYGYALPNVYCGLLTLLLLPLYFTSQSISKKEKILTGIIITFFYFSFAFNLFNFVWHAFHMPNDLPYRFSYIYIFFLLFIALKTILSIKEQNRKIVTITTTVSIITLLLFAIISAPNKTSLTIIGTIILGAIYIIWLLTYIKAPTKKWLPTALVALIILEIFIPYKSSFTTYPKTMLFAYENSVNDFKETISKNSDDFYRMELTEFALLNPSSIYDYHGITSFSSMNYETVSYLQKKLGISSNGQNSNQYLLQTPIYNMMMSMNYLLDTGSTIKVNPNLFKEIYDQNGIKGYESNYKTNIGFATNNPQEWNIDKSSPFDVQTDFANIVTGIKTNYFNNCNSHEATGNGIDVSAVNDTKFNYMLSDSAEKDIIIKTIIAEDGEYYSYMNNKKFAIQYTINGETIMHYGPVSYPYIACLGILKRGDVVEAKLLPRNGTPTTGVIDYYMCSIDMNAVNDLYQSIQYNGLLMASEVSDTYIKASINTKTEYIYTSIPYDKNWEVYVDGIKMPHEELLQYGNAFIGIQTTVGEHTIEFKYKMPTSMFTPILPKIITTK